MALVLYEYLMNHTTPTPERAAVAMGVRPGGARYKRAAHFLKLATINALTSVKTGQRSSNDPNEAARYVWKLIAVAKRQSMVAKSNIVIPFLEEAFRIAEEYALVDAARISSELLNLLLANRYYRPKSYRYYREKATYYRQLDYQIRHIRCATQGVEALLGEGRPAEAAAKASQVLNGIASYRQEVDNLRLHLSCYLLELKTALGRADYATIIRVGREAIGFLQTQPAHHHYLSAPFEASLGFAYLQTRQYEEGIDFAQRYLESQELGTLGYAKNAELIILLALRAGQYRLAWRYFVSLEGYLVSETSSMDGWASLSVFEAYLWWLHETGKLKIEAEKTRKPSFIRAKKRFDRHDTPEVYGFHFDVIQALQELARRRFSSVKNRLEDLGANVKNLPDRRVRQFIRALSVIPAQAFHRVAVLRHAEKHLARMEGLAVADPLMEVVPLEMVWEAFAAELGMKRISTRSSTSR
ncbi:hypothetical protein [Lewinella sp. W8]|uniref:hypothetical protein n=1 Tax=Lewinella sp. W8 TaxID=2528208 RepID=UPI001067758C|nr:hypothetical protein [Lewinella sp. W8]MTB50706.1 hypothetical protein [Lewinella sp. W8]